MFTERKAIEERMDDIKSERRKLHDEYYSLLERLRQIDQRDMNETSIDITDKLADVVEKLSVLIPNVPVDVLVKEVASKLSPEMVATETETPEETKLKEEVQKSKITEPVPARISNEKVAGIIKDFLVEKAPEDVKSKQIEDKVFEETGKRYANFTEKMRNSMEIFPSISKRGHGRYTYILMNEEEKEHENENRLTAV